eukprot:g25069.t1
MLQSGRAPIRWVEGQPTTERREMKYSKAVASDGRYSARLTCDFDEDLEVLVPSGTETLLVDVWLESRTFVEQLDSLLDMRLDRNLVWDDSISMPSAPSAAARRFGRGRPPEILQTLVSLGPHPSQGLVFDACKPCLRFWRGNPRAVTTVLTGLAKRALWDVSVKVMRFLLEYEVSMNHFHVTSVLSACEKRGKWDLALQLLEDTQRHLVPASEVTYNVAMSACGKGSQADQALELLQTMKLEQLTPDDVSYSTAISACSFGGRWEMVLTLLDEMLVKDLPTSSLTYGRLSCVLKTGTEVVKRPDRIKALISSCEKASRWDMAMQMLEEMCDLAIEMDEVPLNSAISACTTSSRWQQALQLTLQMEERMGEFKDKSREKDGKSWLDSHAPNGIIWGTVAAALPDPSSRARLGQWLLHHWRPSRVEQVQVKMKDFKADDNGLRVVRPLGAGLLAFFKPSGVSTEAAVSAMSFRLQRPLCRASRLDGATSGVLPVATGTLSDAGGSWLNFQFAARMASGLNAVLVRRNGPLACLFDRPVGLA